jgi:hypothetical protein
MPIRPFVSPLYLALIMIMPVTSLTDSAPCVACAASTERRKEIQTTEKFGEKALL